MARPELLEEIRTRMHKGETGEAIAGALAKKGWSPEDIRGAFALFAMDAHQPTGSVVVQQFEEDSSSHASERARFLLKFTGGLAFLVMGAWGVQASGVANTISDYLVEHLLPTPVAIDDNAPVVVNDYGVFTYEYPEEVAEGKVKPSAKVVGTRTQATYIPTPKATPPTVQPEPPAPVVADAPTPTISLSASASRVLRGNSVTLTWSVSGATSCTSGGFDTGGALSGSVSVRQTTTTTYKLICENQGSTALKDVRVAIQGVPVVIKDPNPNPSPNPDPTPNPDPNPNPEPDPTPNPVPDPTPPPTPDPTPSGSFAVYSGCERPASSYSRTVYVDPRGGADTGDGSATAPFKSASTAFSAHKIQPGDHVVLMAGAHGSIGIFNYTASKWTWLDFQDGAIAENLRIGAAQRILVTNAEITSRKGANTKLTDFSGSSNIVLADSTLYSIKNSSSLSGPEWPQLSYGVYTDGTPCVAILRNLVTNVSKGMVFNSRAMGSPANSLKTLIQDNTIKNFSADGINPIGSDITIRGNRILDSYVSAADGDGNHDDGIQMFALNGNVLDNIRIEDNWVQDRTSANRPLQNPMQGITEFGEGQVTHITVRNNVVLTDIWHGISLYGASDSVIDHNTVLNSANNPSRKTWISLGAGSFSSAGSSMSNNIAEQFTNPKGLPSTNNQVVSDLPGTFKTYDVSGARFNVGVKSTSPIFGTGAGVSGSNQVALNDAGSLSGNQALAAAGIPVDGFLARLWHLVLTWLRFLVHG